MNYIQLYHEANLIKEAKKKIIIKKKKKTSKETFQSLGIP